MYDKVFSFSCLLTFFFFFFLRQTSRVLPTGFPHEAPQLQVIPRIQNPLVAEDGRVLSQAHDKLQHWSIHTDLGRVVSEIVDSLSPTRPSLPPISQSNLSAPIVMGVPVAPSTSVYTYPPPQPKTTSLPTLPAWQSSPSVVLPPPPSYASSVKGTPTNTTISASTVPPITSHFPELEGKRLRTSIGYQKLLLT